MKKSLVIGFILAVCLGLEYNKVATYLQDIVPFPYPECWLFTIDGFLRDALILGALVLLYSRKKRIPDRVRRYFPVVVVGILYIGDAIFMTSYLELAPGFMTVLSIFTGLFNNIILVLLAAMCYHHWPNKGMKLAYFLTYFLTCLIMIFDAIYFWTTSMHVESVVFDNINIYSAKGIAETTSFTQVAAVLIFLVVLVLLFRVEKPKVSKPNLPWSLLCAIVFGLGLNLSYALLSSGVFSLMDNTPGLDIEVDMERGRVPTRKMLATPINVNFLYKACFKTDKVIKNPADYKPRVISESDQQLLDELGIVPERIFAEPGKAGYDKVILLVLESVHRDYIHFYNSKMPAEATPFLDSLLAKTPRLDNYYSSAIPTTQGLNSTFRSQLIYDSDLPGEKQPSLFRSAQAAGWKGIFMNASSRYYAKEYLEYPKQFGMEVYRAREDIATRGYTGASGWGFHNDVMYEETLKVMQEHKKDKLLLVTKTLDMHQPYPYYGVTWENMPESVRESGVATICGMYWVDQTLKKFFAEAAKQGLMDDRTLFIITADHNPHSGGEYKNLIDRDEDKQNIAPIPLIFVAKNLAPLDRLRTNEYASQEDLAPTLLALMGLKTPEDFMGRNLLEPCTTPYALGYFGGKAFYFSADKNFVSVLDEASPDRPEKDALANYIMYKYIARHIKNTQ